MTVQKTSSISQTFDNAIFSKPTYAVSMCAGATITLIGGLVLAGYYIPQVANCCYYVMGYAMTPDGSAILLFTGFAISSVSTTVGIIKLFDEEEVKTGVLERLTPSKSPFRMHTPFASSQRVARLEEENRALKDEIAVLKNLLTPMPTEIPPPPPTKLFTSSLSQSDLSSSLQGVKLRQVNRDQQPKEKSAEEKELENKSDQQQILAKGLARLRLRISSPTSEGGTPISGNNEYDEFFDSPYKPPADPTKSEPQLIHMGGSNGVSGTPSFASYQPRQLSFDVDVEKPSVAPQPSAKTQGPNVGAKVNLFEGK